MLIIDNHTNDDNVPRMAGPRGCNASGHRLCLSTAPLLHLTHMLTLHLLFATYYLCLLLSMFEAMRWLDGCCKKQMAGRARCNSPVVLAPHHAARQRRSSPHGNRHSTRAEGKYGSQETPGSRRSRQSPLPAANTLTFT